MTSKAGCGYYCFSNLSHVASLIVMVRGFFCQHLTFKTYADLLNLMPDPKLVEYIKSELAAGVDKQTIVNFLIKEGWQQTQIDEAFSNLQLQNPTLTQNVTTLPIQNYKQSTETNQNQTSSQKSKLIFRVFKILFIFVLGIIAFISITYFPSLILELLAGVGLSSGSLSLTFIMIPILAALIPLILILILFWIVLSKLLKKPMLQSKREFFYMLPIIVLNYIGFQIISFNVNVYIYQIVDHYFRYSHYDQFAIFILPTLFFLYLFILLPKISTIITKRLGLVIIFLILTIILLLTSRFIASIINSTINSAIDVSPLQVTRLDETKIQDIAQFEGNINYYYGSYQKLPQGLSDLTPDSTSKQFRFPKTEDYQYRINSQTTYEICATFLTDISKKSYPYYDWHNQFKHPKGNYCFNFTIPDAYIKYPEKPANLDVNYQPMILSGGFDLAKSKRGSHVLQAKVVGPNCTGTDGRSGNKITLSFDRNTYLENIDRYIYQDWQIWDTGCGLEEGNPITFTLDDKPVGIFYTDDGPQYTTCLPFIANKKMTGDGGYTGGFIEIRPSFSPDLDCNNVKLTLAFPTTPTPTPTPSPQSRDKQREMDLYNFRSIINYYKRLKGYYPSNLSQAVALNRTYKMWTDPLTNQQYQYILNSNNSDYQLCAPSFETIQQKCINSTSYFNQTP